MRIKRVFVISGCALLLVASCRSTGSGPSDTAQGRSLYEASPPSSEERPAVSVVAVVDKIEANGYQDFITDGSVISWTVVTFRVLGQGWGTTVHAYCTAHPFLEDAPLLIGQSVRFILPPPVQREAIPLEQLEQLQRLR